MKLLIVSDYPWNKNNSFGKVFSDLFDGIEDLEILNIYCMGGNPNTEMTNIKYFQISMGQIVANLKNKKKPVGKIIEPENLDEKDEMGKTETKWMNVARKTHLRIFSWGRNFIWRIGRWRNKNLIDVVKEFNADVMFTPIYKMPYMNWVHQFVAKIQPVKMVGYYGDDNYSLHQFSLNPFFWIDRLTQRGKVRRTVKMCEYLYVVSEVGKECAERWFKKPCVIMANGNVFDGEPAFKTEYNKERKLVFTGNLGNHRWEELLRIGRVIDKIGGGMTLDIYSASQLKKSILKKYEKCKAIDFKGKVPYTEIERIQRECDVLVHVESFRLKERLAVRESFSTKIVGQMVSCRPQLAVGDARCGSIDHLLRHDGAIVVTDKKQLEQTLIKIRDDDAYLGEYAKKGWECGKKLHNRREIQQNLKKELNELIEKK